MVLVAVGNAGNPLLAAKASTRNSVLKFRNVELDHKWRNAFRAREGILTGGAALYRDDNETLILVVGRARLTDDPNTALTKHLVADTTAAKELVRFVEGLKIRASKEARLDQVRFTEDEKTVFEDIKETLRTTSIVKVQGIARMLKSVGSWEAVDGQYFYAGYVVKLSDAK